MPIARFVMAYTGESVPGHTMYAVGAHQILIVLMISNYTMVFFLSHSCCFRKCYTQKSKQLKVPYVGLKETLQLICEGGGQVTSTGVLFENYFLLF